MSKEQINSPFIKFTYTVLGQDNLPEIKSCIINVGSIVSVQSPSKKAIKFFLNNNQIIDIKLSKDYDSNKLMNQILKLKSTGIDYNVYKISIYKH